MSEIIFVVEEAPEGGYSARAVGESIFTQAEDLALLGKRAGGSGPGTKDNLVEFVRESPLAGAALDIRRSRDSGSKS